MIIFCIVLIVIIVIICLVKLYFVMTCGINKCSKHLVGKVVIITGGNAGIGYETAKDLAFRGARVILACRHEGRGTTARDSIIAATGNRDVHYRNLDLASFASIRRFAEEIVKTEKRLDILINNAGLIEAKNETTEDGLSNVMQSNHFGPFLLTNLLLPLLKSSAPSRIVNVSSIAYLFGDINFQNFERMKTNAYGMINSYCATKLCNVLMTVELERRLRNTGVTANALHPGAVDTSIGISIMRDRPSIKLLQIFLIFFKNAWEGAQTTIHLAVAPEFEDVSGLYYSDCHVSKLTSKAADPELAKKVWEESERIVNL